VSFANDPPPLPSPTPFLQGKKEVPVYILYEAGWTTKANLNAVDNSKILFCCLNVNPDFLVVYLMVYLLYRLRYLSYYNYIQNYELIRRQEKILAKIRVDQCLTFLITSLYSTAL
jgi:hypothetical protein